MQNTISNWVTTATINDPERRELWSLVFPGARVPIESAVLRKVKVPEYGECDAYMLDIDALSLKQLNGVVFLLAKTFELSTQEVWKDIAKGVPIVADGVSVASTVGFSCRSTDEDWELAEEHEEDEP